MYELNSCHLKISTVVLVKNESSFPEGDSCDFLKIKYFSICAEIPPQSHTNQFLVMLPILKLSKASLLIISTILLLSRFHF